MKWVFTFLSAPFVVIVSRDHLYIVIIEGIKVKLSSSVFIYYCEANNNLLGLVKSSKIDTGLDSLLWRHELVSHIELVWLFSDVVG